jgi:hypothetical protein
MKICRECGEKKEITEYYNQARYRDALDPMCKVCRDKTSREYQMLNKEKQKEYRRQYYHKHKDKIKVYRDEWYKKRKHNEKD